MSPITSFNNVCNNTENFLSAVSTIPVIGTPAAICKLALGTIQTITALVLGILSLPLRFCSDDAADFNDHCFSHFVHGLGNMAASLVEAIPLLSFLLFWKRVEGSVENAMDREHQFKYIPYPDVIKADRQAGNDNPLIGFYLKNSLYSNSSEPVFLSPTYFRQATGFNAIIIPG